MYESLEARLHDAFWEAEEGPGELELLRAFHRDHPGRALEMGCGSGRLLLPLLAGGVEIEGIDLSGEMLALCRENAARAGLAPVLHEGDIEDPGLPGPFAAVTLPAFTFQLVTDPSRLLQACHRLLEPGGGLYLTTFVPHAELEGEVPEGEWYPDRDLLLPGGHRATVETRHALHPDRRLLVREHRYRIHGADGTLLESHDCTESIHWLHPEELLAVLADHGFEVTGTVTDFDPQDDTAAEDATVFTVTATKV